MIAIDSFKIGGREIQIAIIYEEKIQGITFPLMGKSFFEKELGVW